MNFVDPKEVDIPTHGTKNRYRTILPSRNFVYLSIYLCAIYNLLTVACFGFLQCYNIRVTHAVYFADP